MIQCKLKLIKCKLGVEIRIPDDYYLEVALQVLMLMLRYQISTLVSVTEALNGRESNMA